MHTRSATAADHHTRPGRSGSRQAVHLAAHRGRACRVGPRPAWLRSLAAPVLWFCECSSLLKAAGLGSSSREERAAVSAPHSRCLPLPIDSGMLDVGRSSGPGGVPRRLTVSHRREIRGGTPYALGSGGLPRWLSLPTPSGSADLWQTETLRQDYPAHHLSFVFPQLEQASLAANTLVAGG